MADPLTPDEISRRVAALIANLQDELRRIDEKHGAERRAAIAASGLPMPLVESLLQSRPGYATVTPMPSTETVTEKHPGPIAEGPVAKLAGELGYASLAAFAEALEEPYDTVRSWNREGRGLPSRVRPKVDKLRAKSKRKG